MRYLVLLLLSGCATSPISRVAEGTYQTLAILDYGQTLDVARRPDCLNEGGGADLFIGEHPSSGQVTAYFALMGSAHFLVTGWLDREVDATDSDGWKAVRALWHVGSIGYEAHTVIGNYRRGVGPFGHNLTALCRHTR